MVHITIQIADTPSLYEKCMLGSIKLRIGYNYFGQKEMCPKSLLDMTNKHEELKIDVQIIVCYN
jgi:hypothetical protein